MAAGHELDNPIWHALIGPQAEFAVGHGKARRFKPDYAPFAAIEAATPEAYRDLAEVVSPGESAILFRPSEESTPPGWEATWTRQLVQMVSEIEIPVGDLPHGAPVKLGDGDDMQGLVARAEPGPFAPRTPEMGHYVGYRGKDRLRAMGGERFRLPNHVELSAIAVDPTARGLGLGAAVILDMARYVRDQGQTPFLHVFPENPAMALYQRLGFRERRRLWVLGRRRLPV